MTDKKINLILPFIFILFLAGQYSHCSEIDFTERNFICQKEFVCRGRTGGAFSFFQGIDFDGNEKSLLFSIDENLNCTEVSVDELLGKIVPAFTYTENLSSFFGNIMFLSDGTGNVFLIHMPEEGILKSESFHVPVNSIEKTFVSFIEGLGSVLYIFGDGKLFKCDLGESFLTPDCPKNVFPETNEIRELRLDMGNNLTIGLFSEEEKVFVFTDSKDGTESRDVGSIVGADPFLCLMNGRQAAVIGDRIKFFDESIPEIIVPLDDGEKIIRAYAAGTESLFFLLEIESSGNERRFAVCSKEKILFEKNCVRDGMFIYSECDNPVFYLTDEDSTEIYSIESQNQKVKQIKRFDRRIFFATCFMENRKYVFADRNSGDLTFAEIKNSLCESEEISFDSGAQNSERIHRLFNSEPDHEKFIPGNTNSVLSILDGSLCIVNIPGRKIQLHDFDLFAKSHVMNQSLFAGLVKNNKFKIFFFGK